MSAVTISLSLCSDSVMFVLFSIVSFVVPFSVRPGHHTPVVMVCAESAEAVAGFRVISVVFG